MAPLTQGWKFIDIVAQDIFLGCCFDHRRNRIMPVMEQFQYFVLSAGGVILCSLRCVTLSEPVGASLAHRRDAELVSLAPCPCLQIPSRDVSQATPACIAGISWFD